MRAAFRTRKRQPSGKAADTPWSRWKPGTLQWIAREATTVATLLEHLEWLHYEKEPKEQSGPPHCGKCGQFLNPDAAGISWSDNEYRCSRCTDIHSIRSSNKANLDTPGDAA
jgi:hypothetical protein